LATLGKIDFGPFSATSANGILSYCACHGFGKIRNANEDSGNRKQAKKKMEIYLFDIFLLLSARSDANSHRESDDS
jgi:hypothetical protein